MRKTVFIILSTIFFIMGCGTDKPNSTLRIMTFNIRYNNPNDGENAWPYRKGLAASVIQFHQADIVGVQEALKDQMLDLEERLPEFSWFGVGRDDGKEAGEFCAIFYKKDRFELLEQNTFWLSETPNILGSIGWDAACIRIVTWGHFKDKISGKDFYHFNTHFDHRGQAARENSANLIVKKIKQIAGDVPAALTGDFNFPPTSPLYSILVKGGPPQTDRVYLADAQSISKQPPHGPDCSYFGFRSKGKPGRKIDFIFVSKGFIVKQHGVLSDHWNGKYPSDHLPVLATLAIDQ
jgi:endonuclease/exonuclease/phosphatase family metal-dependent hydrolase